MRAREKGKIKREGRRVAGEIWREKEKERECVHVCVGEEERQDRTLIRLLVSLACGVGTLRD